MGLIKSIRKIGQKAGTVLRKAAPVVGLIPGVGTVAGAALGAAGSIAEGHRGIKGTLGSALSGGLSGLANSTLLGGKGALGIAGKLKGAVGGKVASAAGSAAGGSSTGDKIKDAALGLIPHNASGGVDLGKILGLGLGGYAAYTGNKEANSLRKQQSAMIGRQTGIADEVANQGRALNASSSKMLAAAEPALLARLAAGQRQTPSFAARFTDTRNPFSKNFPAAPMAMPGSTPPAAPPPAPPAPPIPEAGGAPLALPRGADAPLRPRLPFATARMIS